VPALVRFGLALTRPWARKRQTERAGIETAGGRGPSTSL
jgi:hypothetical protein